MKFITIAFLGFMANLASINALELTQDNYNDLTDSKTVFIKFFAPWCGHCKKMKPDWEKLMDDYADSKTQLVAEVDCTSDGGKPLCDANGVRGYPTLKWGDPSGLEDYSGARDLKTLQSFAEENLKPMCSPSNIDLCDDDQKKEIQKYLDMGIDKLEKEIGEKKEELAKAEADFKAFVEDLQAKYKEAMDNKEKKEAEIKASGLSLMEKCMMSLKKKESKDEL